jgi:hypothetical protein
MPTFGFDLASLGSSLITKTWVLQRAYNWGLLMPTDFGGTFGYLVSQFCQDVDFGDYRISEVSTRQHGAFQRFYAGLQSIDEVTLQFLIPVDNSVMDYFYAWYEKMIDKNGYYYPKSNYAASIFIMLYDQTKIEASRFELKGCFPKAHPKIHPSYTEEGVMMATVILNVDYIEPSSLIGSVRAGITNAVQGVAGGAIKGVTGLAGGISL